MIDRIYNYKFTFYIKKCDGGGKHAILHEIGAGKKN